MEEKNIQSKVEKEIYKRLDHLEPYEIKMPWFRDIFEWFSFFVFGIAPICFGIRYWGKFHHEGLLLAILMGIVTITVCLYYFFKYGNTPYIIRINKEGIHHGNIGLIKWNDISGISLNSFQSSSVRSYYLNVRVRNFQKYKEADQNEQFTLHIGISEERAEIAEAVAKTFLKCSKESGG